MSRIILLNLLIFCFTFQLVAQSPTKFRMVAFYSGKNDPAHISFVHEADRWLTELAKDSCFEYSSTNDWTELNTDNLSDVDVVIFLDTRPDSLPNRMAFQNYMENGGAWLGFHFCAFALDGSTYPQNWDWYHETFLGSGQYKGNTWRPTTAMLKVENHSHSVTNGLPNNFEASPNEWYSWENDLRDNPDIDILVSIDSSSFPLGTGPKKHEIWHDGDYPVVWSNRRFKMLYINMGHNDIDYESGTNKELSFTFNNAIQNKLVIDALFWLMSHDSSSMR
ncbi:ThuA domain-containing protein [Draconibacterium sp. IB214405]|uniref:ThuA domain-containing protein n=1 Tax=Draconibacterium sp. IB214405 TaxID=3097352 RepID=UPI002A124373|nr:ThuA domain-containing protein [Draconibacterium sp. IB214405]MDX8341215.1 ThuA domain-containing protein [Draconibacterium sp. IB214405]